MQRELGEECVLGRWLERTENQVEEFTVVVIGVKPVVDCGLREEGWRQ